ncbi:MAG TPA: sugar ABC transporter permease [Alphaproteobacteria bacterium]|nr:sugar ABC transporter permease [Alphaproteobacteria bacterium]
MQKKQNNQAWFLVLPVFLSVAFSAIIPLMTVVNYSVQDILGPDRRLYVGTEWYHAVLNSTELHAAFFRQLIFSFSVLLIEIPLGLMVALILPVRGWVVSLCLVLLAIPLLIPWNVVGTIWQIFARGDIGLGGSIINHLGISYNYTLDPTDAWVTVLVMDIWHWTSLVVLLCYAGLRAIPDAYYQAAAIDGASRLAVFRYIQLPKLSGVLSIAVLLRFMDSFMVYTEPFVLTGGGPGSSTTFLSQYLVNIGLGQFDLGNAGAFSLIYFLIILLFCYVFYTTVQNLTKGKE